MKKNPTGVFCIDTHFDVNESEKKVTCTFNYSIIGNKNNPLLRLDKSILSTLCKDTLKRYPTFPYFTATATAKMSNEDKNNYEFDIDFGKKLALTKAQMKAYNTANWIYSLIAGELINFTDKIEDFVEGSANSYSIEDDHANYLIEEKYS